MAPAFFIGAPPSIFRFVVGILLLAPLITLGRPTSLTIHPDQPRQQLDGMGCGMIFYQGHVTSLAERGKTELQENLYDAIFKDVPTDFLNLMIRSDHEPENDNSDPYSPEYDSKDFDSPRRTAAICMAARKRNPKIRFIATLYTPPAWMKTNGELTAGGRKRASIKPGMELELAEYCWAFLAFMHQEGVSVEFLSIANVQNSEAGLVINPGRAFANSTVTHIRTSITEDAAIISKATGHDPKVAIELPPRSLNTWRFRKD